jgi:hypothetical protein
MHDRNCDFDGCPGHQVRGPQDLIIISVKERVRGRDVRFFASVDCILFYFATFPSGLLIGDIPAYLAQKRASLAKPSSSNEGDENE